MSRMAQAALKLWASLDDRARTAIALAVAVAVIGLVALMPTDYERCVAEGKNTAFCLTEYCTMPHTPPFKYDCG